MEAVSHDSRNDESQNCLMFRGTLLSKPFQTTEVHRTAHAEDIHVVAVAVVAAVAVSVAFEAVMAGYMYDMVFSHHIVLELR